MLIQVLNTSFDVLFGFLFFLCVPYLSLSLYMARKGFSSILQTFLIISENGPLIIL